MSLGPFFRFRGKTKVCIILAFCVFKVCIIVAHMILFFDIVVSILVFSSLYALFTCPFFLPLMRPGLTQDASLNEYFRLERDVFALELCCCSCSNFF